MSVGQAIDDPGAVWDPPGPWCQPADLAELEDAWDESLLEAAACGDVGFAERMERSLWDREYWGWGPADDPPLECGDDARWVPADVMERLGRPGWVEERAAELNREHARFLAAVHQAGHAQCRYDDGGHPRRDPFALDEVGAALRHSTAMAGSWLSLAEAMIERVPRVYEAMAAGWLDLAKARVVVETTRDLPDDLAGMVVARVLDRAPELANTELRDCLEVAAGELDPDWHRRREQAARSRVRLEFARNPAATGDVALRDIGAVEQAAIKARTDALAHALRDAARAASLGLGLPALRALVAQRVLDGTYVGLDDDALLVALTAELPAWHAAITGTDDPDEGANDGGADDVGPDDVGPDDVGPDDVGTDDRGTDDRGTDDRGTDDRGTDDRGTDDRGTDDRGTDDRGTDDEGTDAGSEGGGPEGGGLEDDGPSPRARPAVLAGTMELRLRFSTVLGLDDLPARVPGAGVVPAASARRMVQRARGGDVPVEWRVVLVDGDGRLEYVLLARPDPPRRASADPGRRVRGRVIVELAAPTTMLAALDSSAHPAWAGLITRARRRLADLVAGGGGVGGPHHPATSLAGAALRFPGAALERWIRVRDRSCIGMTCAAVAHRAEIDHTRAWSARGRTIAGNLGAPCAHCHRLKHEGGWHLAQPAPGWFVWRTPLGASYTVLPRRVLDPALDRVPRPDERPRRVRGVRPPPPRDSGWVERPPRLTANAGIPVPRPSAEPSGYAGEPDF